MKKVLALFLLGSLLLLVQAYPVGAGTTTWPEEISIECAPPSVDPVSVNYTGPVTITWTLSAACTTTVDSVKVVFGASNPWYASQVVTFKILPDSIFVTSPPVARKGTFSYQIIIYWKAGGSTTVNVEVTLVAEKLPSLSTWAALVLALAVIAVSIGLLRRRKIVVT